jgi:class 3 adenylate cyclase
VFVRGRVVPLGFETNGSLARAIAACTTPADAASWLRGGQMQLSPIDRAALETLGAARLLPVRRAGELAAFVALGAKHSGDVYTATDLTLLMAVADKLSSELQRFSDAEVLRQARSMQDRLRRYVPGAVAEQLVTGRDLQTEEREISVLFVDIRGYTALSERLRGEETFLTINRYTEAVSLAVRTHGGAVVEFNGDGMMSVFGAPEPLADKERAALGAARDIIGAVSALVPSESDSERTPILVGIGIATGAAFVGNIQAVDRMIWSAIGNTVNLAARLQALSRDLGAAIVLDSTTAYSTGAVRDDFVPKGKVPIRGRSEPVEVFVLPL